MRVQPAFPSATAPTGSAPTHRAEGARFAQLVARGATVAGSVGSSATVAAAAALLAVQQAQPRVASVGAAIGRADRLLAGLARRQRALLSLADDPTGWQELAQALAAEREPSGSAALDALLDAIELRVAVELAKQERALALPGDPDGTAAPAKEPFT
jgi:hypothetical protein